MGCYDDKKPLPYPVGRYVPWFAGWTEFSPTVPKLYWNVRSAEQRTLALCEQVHKLVCYADMLGEKICLNRKDIDELKDQFQKFMESGFDDYYAEQIEQWINDHMPDIIRQAIRMVWFGLTLDGLFVAYIPESWDDIVFDTGAVYGTSEYGRLILLYDVVSPHDVEQDWITNKEALEDLRKRVTQTETTLYTPMREGGGL